MAAPSKIRFTLPLVVAGTVLSGVVACLPAAGTAALKDSKRWTDKFDLSACVWSSTGRNDFFILEPGYQAVFESRPGKRSVRLQVTVLDQTMTVGSVETRTVEERESRDGELVEVSRNFFAVCAPANDVFYFGEDVDIYQGGKVDNHQGSWVAQKAGAKPGLFMPSRTLLGARFYQEMAPGNAMDRIEITSDSESVKTPAGEFHDCLKTEETTPLEPDERDYKIYARGVGMIQDGELLLAKYGAVSLKNP